MGTASAHVTTGVFISYYFVQGRVTISNDGATIMKLLDIVHPAAKVLADISISQDAEVSRQRVCAFPVAHGQCIACRVPKQTGYLLVDRSEMALQQW